MLTPISTYHRIVYAKQTLQNGYINIETFPIVSTNTEHWDFLVKHDKRLLCELESYIQEALIKALSTCLNIPDGFNNFPELVVSPVEAIKILNSIRSGQPVESLMDKLSTRIYKASDHLCFYASIRVPQIKFLCGEPGAGKSTFKTLASTRMRQLLSVIPVDIILTPNVSFRVPTIIKNMVLNKDLLEQVLVQLRALPVGSTDYTDIRNHMQEGQLGRAMLGLFEIAQMYNVDTEIGHTLFEEWCTAIEVWLLDKRKTPLNDINLKLGIKGNGLSEDMNTIEMELAYFKKWLCLYKFLNIYPIWWIDEFEAIVNLRQGMTGIDKALGFFRDLIDIIIDARTGNGSLFILTTLDGLNATLKYPALATRISGSTDIFTETSPTWYLQNFASWFPPHVLYLFQHLYATAAKVDTFSQAIISNYEYINSDMESYIYTILNSEETPRERLKEITCNILDHLRFETIEFLQQRIGLYCERQEIKIDAVPLTTKIDTGNEPESNYSESLGFDDLDFVDTSIEYYDGVSNISSPQESDIIYFSKQTDLTSIQVLDYLKKEPFRIELNTVGKYLANWRKDNLWEDLPLPIQTKLLSYVANKSKIHQVWADIHLDINTLFNALIKFERTGVSIYEHGQPLSIDAASICDNRDIANLNCINPCISLSEMRNFTYQYSVQHGYIPHDQEVDSFILNFFNQHSPIQYRTSRVGIRFKLTSSSSWWNTKIFSNGKFIADMPLMNGQLFVSNTSVAHA